MKLIELRKHAGLIFAASISYVKGYNDAGAIPHLAQHAEPIAWFKSWSNLDVREPNPSVERTSAVLNFYRQSSSSIELTLIAIAWNDEFVEMIPLNARVIENAVDDEDRGSELRSLTLRLILHAVAALRPDHHFHSVLQSARTRKQARKVLECLCLETDR